jgi:hypothetical protein
MSLEIKKAIKKASILAGQLEKTSLSLIMAREKEIIIVLRDECITCRLIISKYIIYRLISSRIQNKST